MGGALGATVAAHCSSLSKIVRIVAVVRASRVSRTFPTQPLEPRIACPKLQRSPVAQAELLMATTQVYILVRARVQGTGTAVGHLPPTLKKCLLPTPCVGYRVGAMQELDQSKAATRKLPSSVVACQSTKLRRPTAACYTGATGKLVTPGGVVKLTWGGALAQVRA